ncbi:Coiled-coil domain-containing 84 [Rhynchospora pubera]|uniref:Coiled-coil domain-containing 84 n=1 Tax=Rhynchospora pubera TaxID=906938 RepID=A0AAV8EJE4_9POAL|nr:Coiled-coil domain-containing 84 [Rhynchospora pubera]
MGKKQKEKEKRSSCGHAYCEVCRRNHDQGSRHRYFPSHLRAFSSLLSRFSAKLSPLRVSLRNPSLLRPDTNHPTRLWCIFCSVDLVETDSLFACGNAITHLASATHLKNVKDFLWKHGVGADMDRVDSFRITETDLAKWEDCCESLKKASHPPQYGEQPPKDIQTDVTYISSKIDERKICNSYSSVKVPSNSINVMPLQIATNDKYQVSNSLFGGAQPCNGQQGAYGVVASTLPNSMDQRVDHMGDASNGIKGNVHTGAPPPWLELTEQVIDHVPNSHFNKGKSHKLNPKRVGAAWSDKRRTEMEREKRGELVENTSADNWLPNFGRVWQSGSRKDSRKEFDKENSTKKRKGEDMENSELEVQITPYTSKRLRVDLGNDKETG